MFHAAVSANGRPPFAVKDEGPPGAAGAEGDVAEGVVGVGEGAVGVGVGANAVVGAVVGAVVVGGEVGGEVGTVGLSAVVDPVGAGALLVPAGCCGDVESGVAV